jgi:acetyl esterase/lipase
MRRLSMCCLAILCCVPSLQAQDAARPRFDLWADGAPGAKGTAEKDRPSLEVYLPETPNGCGVVVCPGGGYGHLALDHEGKQIGEWFNKFGVTAFVLRYRISPDYQHPSPMLDVQRAIRTVRSRAAEWKLDPARIGVMGFSAGGHLASTAATHFDAGDPSATDAIDKASCRPDFAILCYPVITLTQDFMHRGSRNNLLGKEPDPELVKSLSNELQVTKETPPTFLFHTTEDKGVPPQNSAVFYIACVQNGVPAELHIFEKGRHGIGLGKDVPGAQEWPDRLQTWLGVRGYLEPATK